MRYALAGDDQDALDINPDDYIVIFFDFVTDDKKEDGFAVISMLEALLRIIQDLHPERTRVGIESDGAVCYSEKFARMAMALLSGITGVRVTFHGTGEAQCNKSALDGHFGVAGELIIAVTPTFYRHVTVHH